ncbi:Microtubule-associated protein YTM1 [Candida maltosa Xu316]|uniref:Ribosome biogenesis protein YTM1 n=1 Tax=Candida maltosa (strain Xu316) TaxID=1245528 RepID=M3ISN7_CANMX|nr:Microtubule-associated protein YTM1 [Candida maltosa Xu316]
MSTSSPENKNQIKIKFFTNEEDESLQVSDSPLYVPSSLKRFGLSEVVNHLLGNYGKDEENDDSKAPIPFDFLIDGVLLRTSIDEYLTKNGLSSEAFLSVEYTRAILPPSFLASFNSDDWISSIDSININSKAVTSSQLTISQPKILSGSYDGIVRTYNMSGKVEKQYVGHSAPIKAVRWISPTRIVSAGNDRQVRLWKTSYEDIIDEDDEVEEGKTLAILEGHKAPVVDLAIDQQTNRILSAGYDNFVGFWSTNYKEMTTIQPLEYDANVVSSSSKKRRKMAVQDSTIRRRAPLSLLQGHSEPVEGVIFDANDSTVGYSVSQDHTIKTWDLVTSRCVDTRTTGYSLLSVLQLPEVSLIASGSSARHINLHDPRISTTTDQKTTKLVGHTNFVVGLTASPHNQNMFASSSHDGTVKVWDVRAEKSLYTITREDGTTKNKIFDVCWDSQIGIISGGEDKKIQINKGSDITK